MKRLCVSLIAIMCAINVQAESDDFLTYDEILNSSVNVSTSCATGAFENALKQNAGNISESDEPEKVKQWIYETFAKPDVLQTVLECPEFKSVESDEHVRLQPIKYTFPAGREIVVNYETQPRILQQRIDIATKRNVAALNTPSPEIGGADDTSLWTNVDPAWYAIMVVQHGALDEFVGPDKNNTISLQYIYDNVDKLYPRGAKCTSKSALADDDDMINRAVHATVGLGDDDKNDYYVAGDADLRWISYTEIGLDVVLTVATFGSGTLLTGASKGLRATKTLDSLNDALKILRKSPNVVEYTKNAEKLGKTNQTLARLRRFKQLKSEISTMDKAADIEKATKELETISKELRDIDKVLDESKITGRLEDLEKQAKELESTIEKAAKEEKEVQQYLETQKSYSDIVEYRRAYQNLYKTSKKARTGNVFSRGWRAFRATRKGNKVIDRGVRVARQSVKSGRTRSWLFNTTMRNLGALGRLESTGGILYGAVKFAADMYDWTETSTGEFTNNVDFKPLMLLSADDLDGYENKVNHGMWLLWYGDSTDPADDDAAYLQAMDFANKFHMDLIETMEEHDSNACDVDIFVVRPVLRNPDTANPELYYLIMNDEPWSIGE